MTGVPPHRPVKVRTSVPAFSRTAIELQGYVVRLGAERVAEVLRMPVADLEPMLAGRVKMSRVGLQRLRKLE
jgi:hypothetical protein